MKVIATVERRHEENFEEKLHTLYDLGIRDFRMNYAKISEDNDKIKFYEDCEIIKNIGKDTKIIVDIPYPGKKYRIELFENSKKIEKGLIYRLTFDCENEICEKHKCLFVSENIEYENIKEGMILVYDGGEGAFRVIEINKTYLNIEAINSFTFFNHKSLTLGSLKKYPYREMVEKICVNCIPDAIAFSFIENCQDLKDALLMKEKYNFDILSKIETQTGIENSDDIAMRSDGIILGRGDLGIYSNICNLYTYEQKLSDICKKHHIEYHLATGFMNSCIKQYIPDRSDIIDLSYAARLMPTSIILNVNLSMSENITQAMKYIYQVSSQL